jgi:hypothetical protein
MKVMLSGVMAAGVSGEKINNGVENISANQQWRRK